MTTGFGDAKQLGGNQAGSRCKHHAEHADARIELAVCERQGFGVAFLEVDAQSGRTGAGAGLV
jgi:hypothetical protein